MNRTEKKPILLHVCCAPDATVAIERLSESYNVFLYFYNPNIHPVEEYELREREAMHISEKMGASFVAGDYESDRWFELTGGLEKEPEKGRRCEVCIAMRLRRVAEIAKSKNIETVTRTIFIAILLCLMKSGDMIPVFAGKYKHYIPSTGRQLGVGPKQVSL